METKNERANANEGRCQFIDHGMIHDRVTGKHVDTEPVEYEDGKFDLTPINEACELLNELAALAAAAPGGDAKQAPGEAPQSGDAKQRNAQQPPSSPLNTNEGE